MIKIKPATNSNIDEIASMQARALLTDEYAPLEATVMNLFVKELKRRWEKLIEQQVNILILSSNNETLGFVAYSTQVNDLDIHTLYIKTGHRRSGLGKKLFDYLLNTNHAQIVSTWIQEENPVLKNFYSALGFKSTTSARVETLAEDVVLKEIFYQLHL